MARRRCSRWPARPSARAAGAAWRRRYGFALLDEDHQRGVFSTAAAPQDQAELEHHRWPAPGSTPGGRETLGGAAGAGTRRAVSRPILGAIRRVYVPTAPVTRPLCSGTGAVAVLHPRCGSDTQPATARVSAGPAAAAASAVVAETAPDWPGGLRPSTAAPSPGEWAASSAHGTTRLARYARASLALLLARLSAEPLSMNDAPHDEMLSDPGRP